MKSEPAVCDPDCADRTACVLAGRIGHSGCGKRPCGCPQHHVCGHALAAIVCHLCGITAADDYAELVGSDGVWNCRYGVQCDGRRLRRIEKALEAVQAEIAERCDRLREAANELDRWWSAYRYGVTSPNEMHPRHAAHLMRKVANEISKARSRR